MFQVWSCEACICWQVRAYLLLCTLFSINIFWGPLLAYTTISTGNVNAGICSVATTPTSFKKNQKHRREKIKSNIFVLCKDSLSSVNLKNNPYHQLCMLIIASTSVRCLWLGSISETALVMFIWGLKVWKQHHKLNRQCIRDGLLGDWSRLYSWYCTFSSHMLLLWY